MSQLSQKIFFCMIIIRFLWTNFKRIHVWWTLCCDTAVTFPRNFYLHHFVLLYKKTIYYYYRPYNNIIIFTFWSLPFACVFPQSYDPSIIWFISCFIYLILYKKALSVLPCNFIFIHSLKYSSNKYLLTETRCFRHSSRHWVHSREPKGQKSLSWSIHYYELF